MIYSESVKLDFEDVGKHMAITNRGILRVFEHIATHQSDEAGYGVVDIEGKGVSWLLLDWKITVHKRVYYGETLRVNTWPRSMDRFYSYRDFELYNEAGELCIIGTSKWLLFNTKTERIARITEEVKDKYVLDSKNVYGIEKLEKEEVPDTFDSVYRYKAMRRDIDLNNHVHNLFYLDIAIEALPEDVFAQGEFNDLEISYKKEIKLGEEVRCEYSRAGDVHTIVIRNDRENELHAVIRMF